MHGCPTCAQPTITLWRKCAASSTQPVACKVCGALSHIPDWTHTVSLLLFEVAFWGSIVLAVYLRAWLALFVFPAVLALWAALIGRFAPLVPIRHAQVDANLRRAFVSVVAIAMTALTAYFLFAE